MAQEKQTEQVQNNQSQNKTKAPFLKKNKSVYNNYPLTSEIMHNELMKFFKALEPLGVEIDEENKTFEAHWQFFKYKKVRQINFVTLHFIYRDYFWKTQAKTLFVVPTSKKWSWKKQTHTYNIKQEWNYLELSFATFFMSYYSTRRFDRLICNKKVQKDFREAYDIFRSGKHTTRFGKLFRWLSDNQKIKNRHQLSILNSYIGCSVEEFIENVYKYDFNPAVIRDWRFKHLPLELLFPSIVMFDFGLGWKEYALIIKYIILGVNKLKD